MAAKLILQGLAMFARHLALQLDQGPVRAPSPKSYVASIQCLRLGCSGDLHEEADCKALLQTTDWSWDISALRRTRQKHRKPTGKLNSPKSSQDSDAWLSSLYPAPQDCSTASPPRLVHGSRQPYCWDNHDPPHLK